MPTFLTATRSVTMPRHARRRVCGLGRRGQGGCSWRGRGKGSLIAEGLSGARSVLVVRLVGDARTGKARRTNLERVVTRNMARHGPSRKNKYTHNGPTRTESAPAWCTCHVRVGHGARPPTPPPATATLRSSPPPTDASPSALSLGRMRGGGPTRATPRVWMPRESAGHNGRGFWLGSMDCPMCGVGGGAHRDSMD